MDNGLVTPAAFQPDVLRTITDADMAAEEDAGSGRRQRQSAGSHGATAAAAGHPNHGRSGAMVAVPVGRRLCDQQRRRWAWERADYIPRQDLSGHQGG